MMSKNNNKANKKTFYRGMASMYLVVFVAMLTGIITLSFTRIMLLESKESSDADLSQSAYDAALAGVEEAKLAVLFYHDCVSSGEVKPNSATFIPNTATECQKAIYYMEEGSNNGDCNVVNKILGRQTSVATDSTTETLLQSRYDSSADAEGQFIDQAYTCVTITENTSDYKTTLGGSGDRMRIIPIHSNEYKEIDGFTLKWSSPQGSTDCYSAMGKDTTNSFVKNEGNIITTQICTEGDSYYIPPMVIDIFQTDVNFSIAQLDVNNQNNDGSDHMMLFLSPVATTTATTTNSVPSSDILSISNKSNNPAVSGSNLPKGINCTVSGNGYECNVYIQIPSTYNRGARAESTFFLRTILPYGNPETDISIELCSNPNGAISGCASAADMVKFDGVQAVIDSTGRAGRLFRRVESRVELMDVNYTYPELAIQLIKDKDAEIIKNFWVTQNCWATSNGNKQECDNFGDNTAGF